LARRAVGARWKQHLRSLGTTIGAPAGGRGIRRSHRLRATGLDGWGVDGGKRKVGDPPRRERPPRAGVALGSDSGAPGASTGCRAGRRHAANLGGGYRLSDLLLRRFAGDPLLGGLVRGPGPIETGFAAAL